MKRIITIFIISMIVFSPFYAQKSNIVRSVVKTTGKDIVENLSEKALKHEFKSVSKQYARRIMRKKMRKYCLLRGAQDMNDMVRVATKNRLFKYSSSFSKNLENKEIRNSKYSQKLFEKVKNTKSATDKELKTLAQREILKYNNIVPSHLKHSKEVNKTIETLKKSFTHNDKMSYEILEYADGSYDVILKGNSGNSSTMIRVRTDGIIEAPSLTQMYKSGAIGHNEFLKHLLPNATYKIEPGILCFTDSKGRPFRIQCNLMQTAAGGPFPMRNTAYQSFVGKELLPERIKKTGKEYQGGHLIQLSKGGPDEIQIPMLKEINLKGDWSRIEGLERKCVNKGEDVFIDLQIIYDKDGFPSSFTKITKFKDRTISLTCDNISGETFIKETKNLI